MKKFEGSREREDIKNQREKIEDPVVGIGEEGDAATEGGVPKRKAPGLEALHDEDFARKQIVGDVSREISQWSEKGLPKK